MSSVALLKELTERVQIANKAVVRFASNTSRIGTKEDSKELRSLTIELGNKLCEHLIKTGEELIDYGNNYGSSVLSFAFILYSFLFFFLESIEFNKKSLP